MTVLIVLVILISAGTAAGVALTVLEFNPLEPAQGTLDDSSLVVQNSSLTYSGLDATDLTLGVNNTDAGSAHDGAISVRLLDASGNEVHTQSDSVSVPADSSTIKTVTFTQSHNVTTFETVEVLIEETS